MLIFSLSQAGTHLSKWLSHRCRCRTLVAVLLLNDLIVALELDELHWLHEYMSIQMQKDWSQAYKQKIHYCCPSTSLKNFRTSLASNRFFVQRIGIEESLRETAWSCVGNELDLLSLDKSDFDEVADSWIESTSKEVLWSGAGISMKGLFGSSRGCGGFSCVTKTWDGCSACVVEGVSRGIDLCWSWVTVHACFLRVARGTFDTLSIVYTISLKWI